MTHYELIARAMADGTTYKTYKTSVDVRIYHALLCNQIASSLATTNSLFDRVKFLRACNVSEEDIDAL